MSYKVTLNNNFISVLKNKLRKCNGIGYKELLKNIKIFLKEFIKNTYKNIFKGNYKRKRLYKPTKSIKFKTLKLYKLFGVLNQQRCKIVQNHPF